MVIKKSIKRQASSKSIKTPKSKEPFKSQIFFRFKDLKSSTIEYAAHYVQNGITGKWFNVEIQGSSTNFYEDEAWTIFRKNAIFDDILKSLRTYDIHDIARLSGVPDFKDYQKWTDRKFLKELSFHPEWLAYPKTEATNRLIFLLRTAQVANSKEARNARENLEECLIPKRPGNSKSYPENLEEGLFLLKDLSDYISRKCKQFLRDGDIDDEYLVLQEWGKTEESRIVGMPSNDLLLLVHNPARFAKVKLSRELYVSLGSLKSALGKRKNTESK